MFFPQRSKETDVFFTKKVEKSTELNAIVFQVAIFYISTEILPWPLYDHDSVFIVGYSRSYCEHRRNQYHCIQYFTRF